MTELAGDSGTGDMCAGGSEEVIALSAVSDATNPPDSTEVERFSDWKISCVWETVSTRSTGCETEGGAAGGTSGAGHGLGEPRNAACGVSGVGSDGDSGGDEFRHCGAAAAEEGTGVLLGFRIEEKLSLGDGILLLLVGKGNGNEVGEVYGIETGESKPARESALRRCAYDGAEDGLGGPHEVRSGTVVDAGPAADLP